MVGGERSKLKGRIDGLRYSGVWLLAAAAGTDNPVPSAERAIMNLAFQVASVDEATAALKGKQVKAVVEPRSIPNGTLRYAFFDDPNGARFELVQP
jgi:catechol 2,3-dioxygenase-like lactoylglutathione lyase family enzyme